MRNGTYQIFIRLTTYFDGDHGRFSKNSRLDGLVRNANGEGQSSELEQGSERKGEAELHDETRHSRKVIPEVDEQSPDGGEKEYSWSKTRLKLCCRRGCRFGFGYGYA